MAVAGKGHSLRSDPANVVKAGPMGWPDNVGVAGREEGLSDKGSVERVWERRAGAQVWTDWARDV